MHSPKALPGTTTKLAVWADPSGTPYVVKRQPDGSTTFTPLETALAQPQTPDRATNHDPIALALVGLGALLLLILLGYGLGFLAGASGQRVVMVPSVPVCNTHRSSFMFWSQENKECH